VHIAVYVFNAFQLTGMQFIANDYTTLCLLTIWNDDSSLLMLHTHILHVTLTWLGANPNTYLFNMSCNLRVGACARSFCKLFSCFQNKFWWVKEEIYRPNEWNSIPSFPYIAYAWLNVSISRSTFVRQVTAISYMRFCHYRCMKCKWNGDMKAARIFLIQKYRTYLSEILLLKNLY
jgi:hypothetical protein